MRAAARLLVLLMLAAAGSAMAQEKHLIDPTPPGALNPEPLPQLKNPDAPSTPAKELFARKSTPFPGPPRSIGGYFDGCLAGALPLPITGPTWQVMRLSRNRNWGNPQLVRFIERFAENAKKVGWNGLLVGDMSQPRGGPMLSEHRSHQIGLDVDIWFTPMPDHVQSREEREFGEAADVVAPDSGGHPHLSQRRDQEGTVPRGRRRSRLAFQGASLVWSRRALPCPNRLSGGQCGVQAAGPAARRRRLRSRTRLLVQGVDAASAAVQAETGTDAGRLTPCMQANREGAVIVEVLA
jgi:hypothetical protein